MVIDNIFPTEQLLPSLKEKYDCNFAVVPFMDCQPNTSYLVGDDGRTVIVSVDFGGYSQIKKVQILPAGRRSPNSSPSFRRRNNKGSQASTSLSAAVYGAFVLGEIPKFKISHLDGNPNNNRPENLVVSDKSTFKKNIVALTELYAQKYNIVANIIRRLGRISLEEAQDITSEAFFRMCLSRKEIAPDSAVGLWLLLVKQRFYTFRRDNRLVYEVYDAFQNVCAASSDYEEALEFQSIMNLLPGNCQRAVDLILFGHTQSEAAAKMGCSQAQIHLLLKKSRNILKGYE
ncbi:MAG: HNH endonuclease [Muribaculaceae bacterium]|nr:HNH endonuclease [Muribaculaceae bacterium]